MARSLKALFPEIGRVLAMTPPALYAHQRKFVAAGLLDTVLGHGPGSGVPGTPDSLARFLISEMANATIAENIEFAQSIMNARPLGPMCPLTGAVTFGDALSRVFANRALSDRVRDVGFDNLSAHILVHFDPSQGVFDDSQTPGSSGFLGSLNKHGLRHNTSIDGEAVRALAKLVTQ